MTAEKWDMAAAVTSHLVKVEPEDAGWRSIWHTRHSAARALREQKRFFCERVSCITTMR